MKLSKAIEILTLMGTPGFEGHTENILAARCRGQIMAILRDGPRLVAAPSLDEKKLKKGGS